MWLKSYIDILEEEFASQHLIEDHTCAPDIATLGICLIVFIEVDLGGSV